jgi:hypothetical protein
MAVITAAAITGATITAGTVAAGVATTAALGATVAGSMAQAKGAKKAGEAFANVGRGIQKVDNVEAGIRQLMGVPKEDENTERDKYAILRDQATGIVQSQMAGEVSEQTRTMLARRAVESGAVGLGPGAINDVFTGYLGLTSEAQQQQGFANYRQMFGQLSSVAMQQQAQNYNMQYNAAAAQANSIMGQANATASMWQGIASIAGGVAGGMGGMGGGGASAGGLFGAGFTGGGGGGGTMTGGMQPSQAYFNNMAAAGRNPYVGGQYLGGI